MPPIVHDVLRSPGQPLDPSTRAFFEPRFGHDFSGVRVHTDAQADESARTVGALAYTVGHDIVFRTEQYAPATQAGRRLLAHELTHVVQQAGSVPGSVAQIAPPDDAREYEAERVARTVTEDLAPLGPAVGTSPLALQRLGANAGCSPGEVTVVHQAIFNARGWINKAIPQLAERPLPDKVVNSLRKNFGPTYGVAGNASLILGRLKVAFQTLSKMPLGCAGKDDDVCKASPPPCGYTPVAGGKQAVLCRDPTLIAGADVIYQAGCVLHESLHASFSRFTIDEYSGWHGHSGNTPTYPGTGTDPLLNADSYTTLVMDLS